LLRDAKPQAAEKVDGRPLRAGDRGVARTLGQINPSKDAWDGMTERLGRRYGDVYSLPTRVPRWHCLGRILFADTRIVTLKKDVITPMMGRRRHAA
jgi:hypothetical protein